MGGANKFGMSLEIREIKLFSRDIPGFCRDIPGVPEKFVKKEFVFNSRSLKRGGVMRPLPLHSEAGDISRLPR